MNREKRDVDYPVELEAQFILRLPEEPARALRALLQSGESLKNRLSIQLEPDVRHGEVRLDHWLLHAKVIDLPTIVESLKTIDNKSFYKTADICQMMICKTEPDAPPPPEDEPPRAKKKDPFKVDKKYLYPHGLAPPTKNIRRRRFRKTLKKKYIEAPEIEKEVKRLLRADNEAASVTWEVVMDDDDAHGKPDAHPAKGAKADKKVKQERKLKQESMSMSDTNQSSNVVDIFGGAVSDSDLEDDVNVDMDDSHFSAYDSRMSDSNSMHEQGMKAKEGNLPTQFRPEMFQPPHGRQTPKASAAGHSRSTTPAGPSAIKGGVLSSEEDSEFNTANMSKDNMDFRLSQLRTELEELKQRRQRTQHEISGMENLALRQRFQDILHTLNQDIMYKEMEYQGLLTLQNSEDI